MKIIEGHIDIPEGKNMIEKYKKYKIYHSSLDDLIGFISVMNAISIARNYDYDTPSIEALVESKDCYDFWCYLEETLSENDLDKVFANNDDPRIYRLALFYDDHF